MSDVKDSHPFRPSDSARYMATSAFFSRSDVVEPCSGLRHTPMLAVMQTVCSPILNGFLRSP